MKPITQLSSRGLRNAPVKKMRSMCTPMPATKTSAAQWWICRTSRPPRMSNDSRSVESSAADISTPRIGQERAGVVRRHHRGLEEERQERSREQDDDEAPQRDLAEHERPVVGEDLAAELLDEAGEARALVDVVRGGADEAAAERLAVLPVGLSRRPLAPRDVLGGVSRVLNGAPRSSGRRAR